MSMWIADPDHPGRCAQCGEPEASHEMRSLPYCPDCVGGIGLTADDIAFLRRNGVSEYERLGHGRVRVKLAPLAAQPAPGPIAPQSSPIGEANGGYPTEDEFLFMSSGHPVTKEELNSKPPEES